MKGWTIAEKNALGMGMVEDNKCPLHGSVPAPRVLQNQLDRMLELYIMHTELSLLKAIQRTMRAEGAQARKMVCAGIALVLHVLERDTWRLMYWMKHCEDVSLAPLHCLKRQLNSL